MNFETIPVDLRASGAYFEFDNSKAGGTPAQSRKFLIIAPMDTTNGTATPDVPTLVDSDTKPDSLFGRRSVAAVMGRMFRNVTKGARLYIAGLGAGTTAKEFTLTFTVTGATTTKASTLALYFGGVRVLVPIPSGSDASAVAAAVEAELDARADDVEFAASVLAGVVTGVMNQLGEFGSDLDIRRNYYPSDTDKDDPNIVMVVAESVAGAGNPSVAGVVANLGTTQYNGIALFHADATNLTALENEMATRWEGMSSIDGHIYTAAVGTASEAQTLGLSRNSRHLTILPTDASPTPPWVFAAQLMAARAKRANTAQQLKGDRLPDCLAPEVGAEFTDTQRNTCLFSGISTYSVNDARQVHLQDIITTYKQNAQSVDDWSYLKEARMTNLSTMRWDARVMLLLKYPNAFLADDSTPVPPGVPIATESLLKSDFLELGRQWLKVPRIHKFDDFAAEIEVEADFDNNRVNFLIPPRLIPYFDIAAGKLQFS